MNDENNKHNAKDAKYAKKRKGDSIERAFYLIVTSERNAYFVGIKWV